MGYAGLTPSAERTYMAGVIMDLAKQQQQNTTDIALLAQKMDKLTDRIDALVLKEEEGEENANLCRREVDKQIQDIAVTMKEQGAVNVYKWKMISVISIIIAIGTFIWNVVRPLALGG